MDSLFTADNVESPSKNMFFGGATFISALLTSVLRHDGLLDGIVEGRTNGGLVGKSTGGRR